MNSLSFRIQVCITGINQSLIKVYLMSDNARVLLTHKIPKKGLDLLENRFELVYLDSEKPITPQLQKMLPTVEYLVPLHRGTHVDNT